MNLPAIRPMLPARGPRVPAASKRLLPLVRSSVAVVAAGLAAELALRTLANRVLAALARTARPTAPLAGTVGRASRTVVTEIIVRERFYRLR